MCHLSSAAFKKPSIFFIRRKWRKWPNLGPNACTASLSKRQFAILCVFHAYALFPVFPSLFPASFPFLSLVCPVFPVSFSPSFCEQSFVKQPKRKITKQFLKNLRQLFHPKRLFRHYTWRFFENSFWHQPLPPKNQ